MTGFWRILLVAGTACGFLAPAGHGFAKPLDVVFVSPGKTGEVFWDMVAQSMQAAGRKLDMRVEVLTSERNYRTMQELGFGVVARADKPDFLILSNEESAAVPILEAAEAAGVKTLLLSNTLIGEDAKRLGPPRQKLKTWLGDITTDLQTAGARMASALITAARAEKWQSPDGKIHLLGIGGDEITPASIARNAGLKLAVDAAPDVVVDRLLFANWTQSEAEQVTANYLGWASRKQIRPAGIWAGNDPMALGALRARGRRRPRAGPRHPAGRPQLVRGRAARDQGRAPAADRRRAFPARRLVDRPAARLCRWLRFRGGFAPSRGQDVRDHPAESRLGRRPRQDACVRPDRLYAVQSEAGTLRSL